jgi:uncharacterized membrane protein
MSRTPRGRRQTARPPGSAAPAAQTNLPALGGANTIVQTQMQQGTFETRTYASPLMSPAYMQRLNDILPDGSQQYFDWVKSQTDHRQRMESRALEAQVAMEKRGQVFGFAIALLFGAGAVVLHLQGGNDQVALALVGTPLASLAAVFVIGRLIARNENITKTKILAGQISDQQRGS